MRQIKFRTWHPSGIMAGWGEFCILCKKANSAIQLHEEFIQWQREGIVLMQFTGLLDKNGKEIYEGDIITQGMRAIDRIGTVNFSVEWRDDCGAWGFRGALGLQPFVWSGEIYESSRFEVIGNIHQSPELLK